MNYRKSFTLNRKKLDERSEVNSSILNEVRKKAMVNGNEAQLEKLKKMAAMEREKD